MATSQVETVTLRLQNQLSGPADAALGALGRLENQIVREQNALGRLEESLVLARAQLAAMAAGAPDSKAVAAFERQASAVNELEAKLTSANETLAIMSQARVEPKVFAAAEREAEALGSKLDVAREKMNALKGAAESKSVNLDAYRKQSGAVAQMADKIASQKDKISGFNGKLNEMRGKVDQQKVPLAAVAKTFKLLGGEFGAAEGKGVRVIGLLLKMGVMIGAVVAAVIVASAAVATLVGIFVKSVGAASDMREELLKLRVAGVQWWDAQRANVRPAEQLQNLITGVAASTAVARDKIVDYAVQLKNSYFRGNQLKTALDGMAVAGAAGGDALAQTFLGLAQNARLFGGDLDKLTKRFKDKFGAVAEAKLLSLGTQFAKLKENLAYMFSGADIEPLLKAMHTLLSIFSPNEDAAKSLRDTITKFTERAIGKILDLTIWLLRLYIAIRTNSTAWSLLKQAGTGVIVVFGLIATAVAALGIGIAVIVGAIGVLWHAIDWITDKAGDWIQELRKISLWDIGAAMIDGLVAGIKAAGGKVLGALTSVVGGAVKGVKSFLGVNSPSTLMRAEVGYHMGTGVAMGNEDAAPVVEASSKKMVNAGVLAARGSAGASSGGGGRAFEFHNCTFGGDMNEGHVRKLLHAVFEAEGAEASVPA